MSFTPKRFRQYMHQWRHQLHRIDALPQLAFMGLIVGFSVGGVIIVFRLFIDIPLQFLLPHNVENFEGLDSIQRFLLPVASALIIALGFYVIPKRYHETGINHVLERFHNFQGRMPAGNVLVQFFGAIVSLIGGHSVGREGPAVHIGAGAASLLGQWFHLPHNSLRTLMGCGVAAAIAASFDTPVAGVIFAMEVVLMHYSIIGFIPVMIAAVCGAMVTRLTLGEDHFLTFTDFHLYSLWEVPYLLITGFVIGLLAAAYMRLQLSLSHFSCYSVSIRIVFAGLITGCVALVVPEVLGLGYDTINLALESQLTLQALVILIVAKLVITAFSIAMGLPGGLIGPQLFIGACAGAIMGHLINGFFPDSVSHSSFYVLLGMAAMMGAVINAPLAALMAVLELTYNPSIMFPSMLIIIVSCITTRQWLTGDSIFVEQLKYKGKSLALSPVKQWLNSVGVGSVMQTSWVQCRAVMSLTATRQMLEKNPLWIIVVSGNHNTVLLKAADVASFINETESPADTNSDLCLLEIPVRRFTLNAIPDTATLYEAQQQLAQSHSDALYVTSRITQSTNTAIIPPVLGIITQDTIDHHYQL